MGPSVAVVVAVIGTGTGVVGTGRCYHYRHMNDLEDHGRCLTASSAAVE